jgi:hypothetical protein
MVYATNDRQRVHFAKRAVETLLRAISRDKDRAEGLAAFGTALFQKKCRPCSGTS